MPRIAVIIPTYNRAALVTRAIESVLAQTYTNYELVVVDDGSEDNTLEIVKQYSGCRYVRVEHSGLPSVVRNAGVRSTDTPYVAFLDSDDEWLPDKLAVQTEILESDPDVGLVCSNAFLTEGGDPEKRELYLKHGQGKSGRILKELIRDNFIITSTVLMRRDTFERSGGFCEDPKLQAVEDYDLWLRLDPRSSIRYIPDPLAVYRKGPSSLSKSRNGAEHWRVLAYIFERCRRNVKVDDAEGLLRALDESLATTWRAQCDAHVRTHKYVEFSKTFSSFFWRQPVPALKFLLTKLLSGL
jgi:glycosyltransferase involved in cell wall biosynthesis